MFEKIVLIGAGSAMFTRGLVADLIQRNQKMELGLVDIDPDALNVAEKLACKMIQAKQSPIELSASTDRRDLLTGATAVICTIGVGGRRAWEQDVFIPRKYGIYQPVGDTAMPGGSSRALRMIPAMVDIAKDILDLAPDALFFNYGNPMSCVCRAVRKATGANIVGLCHGVNHISHYLAGVLGADHSKMTYNAVGINHLTWFTDVRLDGKSEMPRLLDIARERGSLTDAEPAVDEPFSWKLTNLFGAFPAVVDRHVSEFFPHMFPQGRYYGKVLGIDAFSFEDCIRFGDETFDRMKEDALSPAPLSDEYWESISGEHEQVIEIIDSIRADAVKVYSVNLPNTGQVPNLPMDAVVECPAISGADGLKAVYQPALSPGIAGTLATRFQWVETVVDAALEGSREKFIQALVLDGAVDSLEMAARLADELLSAQSEYLPQFAK
ncbi:MAG: family 4 glycosyl hydrolase [Armatimonadota bacterium]